MPAPYNDGMQKGRDNTANGRSTDGALKVVLAALAGNLAIAITKFVAFAFTPRPPSSPKASTPWSTPPTRSCC